MFVLRNNIHAIEEAIKSDTRMPPGSWASRAARCSSVLVAFSGSRSRDHLKEKVEFYGVTPKRVAFLMRECVNRAISSVAEYRARGIDPQVLVTVKPHFDRVKSNAAKWSQWVETIGRGGASAESDSQ